MKKSLIVLGLLSILSLNFSAVQANPMPPMHQNNHQPAQQQMYKPQSPKAQVNHARYDKHCSEHNSSTGAIVATGVISGLIGLMIGSSL